MNENGSVQYPAFRWFVLFTLIIVTGSSAMVMISPTTLIEMISETMGRTRGEVSGITMGVFNLFMAIAAITGGFFIDRFGVIRVWVSSLVLIILGVALVPFIGDSASGMTLIRILQGCGTGPIMATIVTVAAQWFPMHERGIVTGIQGFSVSFGIAVGFYFTPRIYAAIGNWQTAMAWLNVGTLIAMGLAFIVAMGPKPPVDHLADNSSPEISGRDFKLALLQIATWAAIFCGFLNSWEYQAFNDLIPNYLAADSPVGLGLGPVGAGNLMLICTIAYMVGSIMSGIISEKIFGGRAKPVVMIGFIISGGLAFSLKFSAFTSDQYVLALCLILIGFFAAVVNPQVFAFIAKYYPEHLSGKLAGLTMAIFGFGSTLGISAGSYALHTTGLYQMSINLVTAAALVGVIVAFGLNPPRVFQWGKD